MLNFKVPRQTAFVIQKPAVELWLTRVKQPFTGCVRLAEKEDFPLVLEYQELYLPLSFPAKSRNLVADDVNTTSGNVSRVVSASRGLDQVFDLPVCD